MQSERVRVCVVLSHVGRIRNNVLVLVLLLLALLLLVPLSAGIRPPARSLLAQPPVQLRAAWCSMGGTSSSCLIW